MSGTFQEMSCNAIRISRLASDGTPKYNTAMGAFALCAGLNQFKFDHVIQAGTDIFELDGAGNPCVIRKRPDFVKYTTFELTVCTRDHRLDEIILGGGASALGPAPTPSGKTINVAQGCGTPNSILPVCIELWSEEWNCDVPNTTTPYLRAILGMAYCTPAGFVKQDGVAKPVYKGFSVPNPNLTDGPFGDLDSLVGFTNWSYAEVDDTALPTCPSPSAYLPLPSSAS